VNDLLEVCALFSRMSRFRTCIARLANLSPDKVHGLGGTFNYVTGDDFTDKSGALSAPVAFGNSWKYPAKCPEVSAAGTLSRACEINSHVGKLNLFIRLL